MPNRVSFQPLLRESAQAVAVLIACSLLFACASEEWAHRHERDVDRILAGGADRGLQERTRQLVAPESPRPDESAASPAVGSEALVSETRILDLGGALEIAVRSSREYVAREEALVIDAIALSNVRHGFSPRLAAALSTLFSDGKGLTPVTQASLGVSLSQALASGGNLALDASASGTATGGFDPETPESSATALSIRLTQPLLRGSGSELALEPLVQAERNLVYAMRGFELFREDFSIDVAARFFGLVRQKQAIENQQRNLQGFVFGRRQAEALFEVGRTSELDVLRSRRSELGSQNDLIEAEEAYQLELDRFRIFLGLPATARIDVASTLPVFRSCDYDLQSAIRAARANRLDLWNQRERLQDAERGLRIARDRLRPDLSFTAAYTLADASTESLAPGVPEDDDYSAGFVLELPLDRLSERNALRATQIGLVQARRSFEEFEDQLVVGIQSAFRELERRKQSLDIQRQLIADQERNVKIAQLRFEQGDFSNRDVVEAQEALLEAQNALIGEQVAYEIARLELLRNLGILFIDEKGMWVE